MNVLNRRDALVLAATLMPTYETAAQDKDRWVIERERVLACGLTEAEAECWELVAKAAGKFFALPKLHEMDEHEVSHAIHVIQWKLLGRPAYRGYLDQAKAQAK